MTAEVSELVRINAAAFARISEGRPFVTCSWTSKETRFDWVNIETAGHKNIMAVAFHLPEADNDLAEVEATLRNVVNQIRSQ